MAHRTPRPAVAVMIGLCLVGLAIRLWLGWYMGHLGDLQSWQLWGLDPGEYVARPGSPEALSMRNNYPPLYPSVLRIMRWVHRGLHLPGDYATPFMGVFHENPDRWRPLILYLKLPPILSDLATAWMLFLIGRHFGRAWLGTGLAAFYLLSPGILYDGAYYGQTDTILVMFLVVAVWAYFSRRPIWLGAMLVAAPLMKAQAIFALPVLVAAMLGERRAWWPMRWKIVAGGLLSLAAVIALACWTGQLRQFHAGYFTIIGYYPRVTSGAYNLWWLLHRPWDKPPVQGDFGPDTVRLCGLLTYREIGAAMYFTALGLVIWRLHKARYKPYALALALAAMGWAFFDLPTQMHERYSIPAVGLMTLLPLWHRQWWWPAMLASCTSALNIAGVCYLFFPPSKLLTSAVNYFIFPEAQATWVIFAVVHILMLPLLLAALWREARPDSPLTPGCARNSIG